MNISGPLWWLAGITAVVSSDHSARLWYHVVWRHQSAASKWDGVARASTPSIARTEQPERIATDCFDWHWFIKDYLLTYLLTNLYIRKLNWSLIRLYGDKHTPIMYFIYLDNCIKMIRDFYLQLASKTPKIYTVSYFYMVVKKVKSFPEPQGPIGRRWSPFHSPQPDTSRSRKTTDTGPVHRVVCPFTPH